MPDKALIVARLSKKDPEDSVDEASDESGEYSDKLSDIARDLLEAIKKGDSEEFVDYLCEFINEHLKENK